MDSRLYLLTLPLCLSLGCATTAPRTKLSAKRLGVSRDVLKEVKVENLNTESVAVDDIYLTIPSGEKLKNEASDCSELAESLKNKFSSLISQVGCEANTDTDSDTPYEFRVNFFKKTLLKVYSKAGNTAGNCKEWFQQMQDRFSTEHLMNDHDLVKTAKGEKMSCIVYTIPAAK